MIKERCKKDMKENYIKKSKEIFKNMQKAYDNKRTYLINDIDLNIRGIGKSYNLVKLAIEKKQPIFCGCQTTGNYLKELAQREFNAEVEIIPLVSFDMTRGKHLPEIILTEGLAYSIIKEYFLEKGQIVIGTYRG